MQRKIIIVLIIYVILLLLGSVWLSLNPYYVKLSNLDERKLMETVGKMVVQEEIDRSTREKQKSEIKNTEAVELLVDPIEEMTFSEKNYWSSYHVSFEAGEIQVDIAEELEIEKKDKLRAVRILRNNFSEREIKELVEMADEGLTEKEYEDIKALMKSRLDEETYEEVKNLVLKYLKA